MRGDTGQEPAEGVVLLDDMGLELQFGCEGMASKIKPLSTAQMAKRYAAGELDPRIG